MKVLENFSILQLLCKFVLRCYFMLYDTGVILSFHPTGHVCTSCFWSTGCNALQTTRLRYGA